MKKEITLCDQCGKETLDAMRITLSFPTHPTTRDFCHDHCLRAWVLERTSAPEEESKPTQTVDPGEGYRLLEVGEDRFPTDEARSPLSDEWETIGEAILRINPKIMVSHRPHRRRIEPAILSAPDGVGVWEAKFPGSSNAWKTLRLIQKSNVFCTVEHNIITDSILEWIKMGWTEWRRPALAVLPDGSKVVSNSALTRGAIPARV